MQPKPLFTVFGVPVFVEPPFWLMAVLFGVAAHQGNPRAVFLWVPIMFTAILLHELGHALMARAFGLQSFIVFQGVGFGLTVYGNRPGQGTTTKPGQIILITVVGPLVGLVVGAIAFWLSGVIDTSQRPLLAMAMRDIVFTNFVWALFNLMPVFPLDGGTIVLVTLERFFGFKGVIFSRYLFIALAILASVLFVSGSITGRVELMPAMIFGFFAVDNYRRLREEERFGAKLANRGAPERNSSPEKPAAVPARSVLSAEDAMTRAYTNLEQALAQIGSEGGRALANEVVELSEQALLGPTNEADRHELIHLLAWGHLLAGKASDAEQALSRLPSKAASDALLHGAIELELGHASAAVPLLTEALQQKNDDFVSSRLARAVALSGDITTVEPLFQNAFRALGARPLQIIVHDLFHAGNYAKSALLGGKLFELHHQGEDAFNVACALSRESQFGEAADWLHRAIEAGLKDPTLVETDADLALLRSRPEFESVRTRLS